MSWTRRLHGLAGALGAAAAAMAGAGAQGQVLNDACATAITLNCNSTVVADNTLASSFAGDPPYSCHASGTPTRGVNTIWYKFVASHTSARLSTCTSQAPADDSILGVYSGACGNLVEVACAEDQCGQSGYLSDVCVVGLMVGQTYYVQLAAFHISDAGPYMLQLECPCPSPCDVACPGGSIAENEPDCGIPVDSVNGGCNFTPASFLPVTCGQTYCGSAAFTGSQRDTDWYAVTLSQPTTVTWCVEAEFRVELGIVNTEGVPGCPTGSLLAFDQAEACEPVCVESCLGPGTWYLVVAPEFIPGSTVTCGLQYAASLTCAPGQGSLNDECAAALPVAVGGSVTGNTGCASRSCRPVCADNTLSPDLWYTVVGDGTTYTATTCGPGTTFDTVLTVYCGSCADPGCVGSNDDASPPLDPACELAGDPGFNRKSRFTWCTSPGQVYRIVVHGFADLSGPFELSVTSDGVPCGPAAPCAPCTVTCPPGSNTEGEGNCGIPLDTVNGGCDASPPEFSPIECGEDYCSSAAASAGLRDTDWYVLSLTQETLINWCVTPEFPVIAGIVNNGGVNNCAGVSGYVAVAFGDACQTTCVSACLSSGQWYLYVAPQLFDGICCGSQYAASVSCAGCAAGACCLEDGECIEVDNEAVCDQLEGVAFIEGAFCTPDPCPGVPGNNFCADALPVSEGTTPFDLYLATTDGPSHEDCTFFGVSQIYNDIWFEYTATCGGELRIETCGSERDTKLAVYQGVACGPAALEANLVECNDDAVCGGQGTFQSIVAFQAQVGSTYLIRVGTFFETVPGPTDNVLSITCNDCEGDCDLPPDGRVNVNDLLALLSQWGLPGSCNADGDAATDVGDLLLLLADWGLCN